MKGVRIAQQNYIMMFYKFRNSTNSSHFGVPSWRNCELSSSMIERRTTLMHILQHKDVERWWHSRENEQARIDK